MRVLGKSYSYIIDKFGLITTLGEYVGMGFAISIESKPEIGKVVVFKPRWEHNPLCPAPVMYPFFPEVFYEENFWEIMSLLAFSKNYMEEQNLPENLTDDQFSYIYRDPDSLCKIVEAI